MKFVFLQFGSLNNRILHLIIVIRLQQLNQERRYIILFFLINQEIIDSNLNVGIRIYIYLNI